MGLPLKALRPNDGQGVTTALVAGAVRMHWVGAIDIPAQCDAIISAATSGVRSCNSDLERLYLTLTDRPGTVGLRYRVSGRFTRSQGR